MRIRFAHLRERSTAGGFIDFAVFDAIASSDTDDDRADLLSDLTMRARYLGLKVDVSALLYQENGQLRSYGDRAVVDYFSRRGMPRWTHYLEV